MEKSTAEKQPACLVTAKASRLFWVWLPVPISLQ